MKVEITKSLIKRGERASCVDCPVALAINKTFKLHHASVDNGCAMAVDKNNKTIYFKLPKKAKNFIERFDDGKRVKPFTFELREDKEFIN